MPNAKLIVAPFAGETREVELAEGITSFGRAPDNIIPFAGDTNVSRYHAEIERRGDNFYVVDLGSSNGTTVNGTRLHGERKLQNGDTVIFGGDSRVEFRHPEAEEPAEEKAAEDAGDAPASSAPAAAQTDSAAAAPATSKLPIVLAVAAVLGGLAIVSVVAMVMFLPSVGGSSGGGGGGGIFSGGCSGSATILTPENGITIDEETPVKLDVKNPNCIERIIFQLDGDEIASVETPPYAVTLAPENMGRFADENSHVLTIAVQNRNGGKPVVQADELTLAFSDEESDDPPTGDEQQPGEPIDKPRRDDPPDDRQITIADAKQMSERLIKQFAGDTGTAYKTDAQFLLQVQKKTAEFKSDGYFNRAAAYRDQINIAFVNEKGLHPSLGYLLAMSRTKFDLKNQTAQELGLWLMTEAFAAGNGYKGQCGADALNSPNQECAARAAAIYTKALVDLFQGDVLYAVACYGMSPQEAGQLQLTLPPDRSDFWNAFRGQKQRDNLVKFFAAGIVAENPGKFNLKRDKPLSNLYKNLLAAKQP